MANNSDIHNPYLAARREWNERYGSYISRAANWRLVALASLAIAAISVVGVGYIGAQSKVVPYIVTIDKLGATVSTGPAERALPVDPRIVRYQLGELITNLRTVTSDRDVQALILAKAYRTLAKSSEAINYVNDYFSKDEGNPYKRVATMVVTPEVTSILPESATAYQIEWSEKLSSLNGLPIGAPSRYKAHLTVSFNPPTDENSVQTNPTGVYVTNITWAKQF